MEGRREQWMGGAVAHAARMGTAPAAAADVASPTRMGWAAPRPAIDFDALGDVDLDRLERGVQLDAERVGEGRYHVRGGEGDHWVDLYSTAHPRCDCGDHLWRDRLCKHILAGLLREGNDRVVAALARLFARLRGGVTRAA